MAGELTISIWEEESGKPRLTVGRKVAMGEILGRTSNSGASAVHIHYAQMKDIAREGDALDTLATASASNWGSVLSDGTKIRTRFNGRAIDTYLANEDSWGHFNSDESEKIRSFNCPAGRFVKWASGGNHFILRHHPGNGNMRINLVGLTTGNNPLQLNRTDRNNWNLIVPFYSAANSQAHMLQYDFATGKARFSRISPGYDGLTILKTHSIYPGWTEMVPIRIGGKPHVISYDSRYGWFNVDQFNATSDGFVSRLKTKVRTGFTNIVPYEEGPRRYAIMYKGSTGEVVVQKLTRNPNQSVRRERVHSENRAKGFTHLNLLWHRGQRLLFGYNSATGRTRVWRIKRNGQGLEDGARLTWQPGWTAITPYLHNSRGHLIVYRATDGLTRKVRLKDNLSGFDHLFSENWGKRLQVVDGTTVQQVGFAS